MHGWLPFPVGSEACSERQLFTGIYASRIAAILAAAGDVQSDYPGFSGNPG
mgnify:CR=1 FL=1